MLKVKEELQNNLALHKIEKSLSSDQFTTSDTPYYRSLLDAKDKLESIQVDYDKTMRVLNKQQVTVRRLEEFRDNESSKRSASEMVSGKILRKSHMFLSLNSLFFLSSLS